MMMLLYLFIGFIVQFFMVKKYWNRLVYKIDKGAYDEKQWLSHKEGWMITFVPIFWIVTLPIILLWYILEKIYNKFNKNSNEETN